MDLMENYLDANFEIAFNILTANFSILIKTTGVKELYKKIQEFDFETPQLMPYRGIQSFFGVEFEGSGLPTYHGKLN